jgi:hypothetical protein
MSFAGAGCVGFANSTFDPKDRLSDIEQIAPRAAFT